MLLEQHVVGVAKRDQLAPRLGDASIARRCDALILLPDQPDPAVMGDGDLGRLVGGAFIDDDELQLTVRLPETDA